MTFRKYKLQQKQEHPKWKWFQEVEKFQNESVQTLQEFEEKLQLHNSSLLSHPLVMKLQVFAISLCMYV